MRHRRQPFSTQTSLKGLSELIGHLALTERKNKKIITKCSVPRHTTKNEELVILKAHGMPITGLKMAAGGKFLPHYAILLSYARLRMLIRHLSQPRWETFATKTSSNTVLLSNPPTTYTWFAKQIVACMYRLEGLLPLNRSGIQLLLSNWGKQDSGGSNQPFCNNSPSERTVLSGCMPP